MTSTPTSTTQHPAPCGPMLACWRSANPAGRADRYPDAVTDTTRRRAARARRVLPQVRAMRRAALVAGGDVVMVHAVLPLPGGVYDVDQTAARALVGAAVGCWPAWFTRETAPDTGHHAHVITSQSAAAALRAAGARVSVIGERGKVGKATRQAVPVLCPERIRSELENVVHYLSKPQDARACRLNHQRHPDPVEVAGAAEDYLAARHRAHQQGRRLPNRSAALNVPSTATRSPLVSLLACLAGAGHELARCYAERAARRARIAAVMARRRADRHRTPAPRPAPRRDVYRDARPPAADGNPQTANRQRPPPPPSLRPVDALR